jgi:cell division protein FtsB
MAIIRSPNDPVRLFWRRLVILGLFLLVAFAASGVWNAYQKEKESRELRAQTQAQLNDLTTQQGELSSDIDKLQTERGKEAVLRQQYALAAKGEGMIVIVDPSTSTQVAATSSAFAEWLHNTFPWW